MDPATGGQAAARRTRGCTCHAGCTEVLNAARLRTDSVPFILRMAPLGLRSAKLPATAVLYAVSARYHTPRMEISMPERRPFPTGLFVVIIFAASWPAQIAARLLVGHEVSRHAFSAPAMLMVSLGIPSLFHRQDAVCDLNAVALLMVGVGTLLVDRLFVRRGFSNAGWQSGRLWHYAAVCGLTLLIWLFPCLAAPMTKRVVFLSNPTPLTFAWLLILALGAIVPVFAAEFGWRGYLLPNLLERHNPRKAVLLQGIIWWAWYLPSAFGAAIDAGIAAGSEWRMPVFQSIAVAVSVVAIATLVPVVLHAVILAYIRLRSGSLAVVALYYGAFECVRDSVGTIKAFDPLVVGLWANAVICAVGAFLLWQADWFALARRSQRANQRGASQA